jgi:hypothetical protein
MKIHSLKNKKTGEERGKREEKEERKGGFPLSSAL